MRALLLRQEIFHFGTVEVRLQLPDSSQLKEQPASDGRLMPPYWAKLWPASLALSRFITDNTEIVAGKKVLELAAGLGLPGMTAAYLAATVTVSDYVVDAVQLMQKTIALNRLTNVNCRPLDWAALPDEVFATEVLLLSDVNYDPATFTELYKALRRFLQAGVTVVLATPQRLMAKPFVMQLMDWCCRQEEELVEWEGEHTWVSLYILREVAVNKHTT